MKLLVVGNAAHIFVLNFVKALKNYQEEIVVDIIDSAIDEKRDNKDKVFETIYNKVYSLGYLNKNLRRIFGAPTVFSLWKFHQYIGLIKKEKYDVILFHGLGNPAFMLRIINQLKISYVVGAFWGSDFYRRKISRDHILNKALDKCDSIIISTQQMQQDIQTVFKIDNEKIYNCLFGLAPLQKIFDIMFKENDISDLKNKIGFKENERIITCGYASRPEMRHMEMIEAIEQCIDKLPENIHLVFPMTYGRGKDYTDVVRSKLNKLNLNYTLLEDFMSDDDIAYLRIITDIFIQIQTTDANSGSMQEHLLAQNIVITGSWLPYDHHKQKNLYFETVESPEELKNKLVYIFENYDLLKERVKRQNTSEKFQSLLWSETIKDWGYILNLYRDKK